MEVKAREGCGSKARLLIKCRGAVDGHSTARSGGVWHYLANELIRMTSFHLLPSPKHHPYHLGNTASYESPQRAEALSAACDFKVGL